MLTIKGTGCALIDYLYSDIRLDSEVFKRYRSKKSGDGGLEPGKLVFVEDLERFADRPFSEILNNLSGGRKPDRRRCLKVTRFRCNSMARVAMMKAGKP